MEKQSERIPESLRSFILDGTPEEIMERYAALPHRAKEADFGEFDEDIVVLDTETTGFSFHHDELTQIAAARMNHGEIVDWFITFVNPGKPIPDDVAHLTDIHDEDVADAPLPYDALAQLVAFVGDSKIVAHNVGFDRTFTTRHPSGYPLLENTWIDSLDLARIALPRLKSHRLIDIVKAFDAPLSTHRADADVAATCAAYRILLAGVEAMPLELVECIAGMATREQWQTRVVFEYFAENGKQSTQEGETHRPTMLSLRTLRWGRVNRTVKKSGAEAETADGSERPMAFPSQEEVNEAFSEHGLVGQLYSSFEDRPEQRQMAQAIRAAFEKGENLVVEAGTGVGKSMAYLVPCALAARANDMTVGIATKTNALLDQLMYHELPALSETLGQQAQGRPLTYAALKGFSHYPCLRKVNRMAQEGPREREVQGELKTQAPALAALLSYVEQTSYDDMDSLKIDYRLLPRAAITTTSHECLRRKCPFFGTTCFVHGARRRAEQADIVVTNHSLLFCDLAADGGLLPDAKLWVVDEAHNAEDEARRAFSIKLAAEDLLRLAARVESAEAGKGMFLRAEKKAVSASSDEQQTLFYALLAKAKSSGVTWAQTAREFCKHMKDLLYFDQNKRSHGYEYTELWISADVRRSSVFQALASYGKTMRDASEKLISACQDLVAYLEDVEGAADVQREIASTALELKDAASAEEVIFDVASEGFAYSATLCRKKDRPAEAVEALMMNVGSALNETLYAKTRSVVYTSATLSIDNSFRSFEEAVGLNAGEDSACAELQLDSSYDFDNNMIVYVISDIPEPNSPHYLPALQQLLVRAHIAQEGSMLTLFTNRREMEKCFDAVQPELKANDLRLVCQKWGVSVKGLRDDFLKDEHLSLFALKSFWEGFDAPGATLKGVIIPKLPFSKPTDPLSCERAEHDDRAWSHYVLPKAIIELKQAAGRLIRKADDTGVLILADRRLLTKSYGKVFLNSLPTHSVKISSIDQAVEALSLMR
ncbi:MAG: helicase C-terminal domain-containing protein [Eggerthellaceae bacterium]|nr:helicase C-terminal domain-containing protein [Eggerthellaceae bacterium]